MGPSETVKLTLYVAADAPACVRAIGNLERIVGEQDGDAIELEIVDIVEQPERAEEARILATPTLVKDAPEPVRRLVGDLSDRAAVLENLGLPDDEEGTDP